MATAAAIPAIKVSWRATGVAARFLNEASLESVEVATALSAMVQQVR